MSQRIYVPTNSIANLKHVVSRLDEALRDAYDELDDGDFLDSEQAGLLHADIDERFQDIEHGVRAISRMLDQLGATAREDQS